jgi:hypothetical protein
MLQSAEGGPGANDQGTNPSNQLTSIPVQDRVRGAFIPLGLDDQSPTSDPNNNIDYTGAGTKAYNACEAANRQADLLNEAAKARAKGDWKTFNDLQALADTQLNEWMKNTVGKPQDAPPLPRGPEPEPTLSPNTIKPMPPPQI